QKFEVLAPVIELAVQRNRPPQLAPVANGRKRVRRSAMKRLPQIEHQRLSRWYELETVGHWDAAIGAAVIFSPRKKRAVSGEIVDRRLNAVMDLDFVRHRIGPDVDQPTGRTVLGPRRGTAVEIQNEGGIE